MSQGDWSSDVCSSDLDGNHAVLLAIRSIDADERDNIPRAGVTAITMSDIDRTGIAAAVERAISVASGGAGIPVSLEIGRASCRARLEESEATGAVAQ